MVGGSNSFVNSSKLVELHHFLQPRLAIYWLSLHWPTSSQCDQKSLQSFFLDSRQFDKVFRSWLHFSNTFLIRSRSLFLKRASRRASKYRGKSTLQTLLHQGKPHFAVGRRLSSPSSYSHWIPAGPSLVLLIPLDIDVWLRYSACANPRTCQNYCAGLMKADELKTYPPLEFLAVKSVKHTI